MIRDKGKTCGGVCPRDCGGNNDVGIIGEGGVVFTVNDRDLCYSSVWRKV